MLIGAAAAFYFRHPALTAGFLFLYREIINARGFTHAIMQLPGDTRRHRHVDHGQYGKEKFVHSCKIRNIYEKRAE